MVSRTNKNSDRCWINIAPRQRHPNYTIFVLAWKVFSHQTIGTHTHNTPLPLLADTSPKAGADILTARQVALPKLKYLLRAFNLTGYADVLRIRLFCSINSHGILPNDRQEFLHTHSAILFAVIKYRFLYVSCLKNTKKSSIVGSSSNFIFFA